MQNCNVCMQREMFLCTKASEIEAKKDKKISIQITKLTQVVSKNKCRENNNETNDNIHHHNPHIVAFPPFHSHRKCRMTTH